MGFRLYQHFDDKDISTEYSALMSKVMANGNGRVKFPDQRACRGPAEIADRRVSGVLPRAGRAAHRHGDGRHHRTRCRRLRDQGVEFLRVPTTYYEELAGARREDRRAGGSSWRNWASWWIATTKATCCRSSRSRWRIGRHCSTKSSSAKAAAVSAKATSRRCSKPSSANRSFAATSRKPRQAAITPFLAKLTNC